MCNCKNVEIGSYANQVELSLPPHMAAYKAKQGGANTICVDTCVAEEVKELWALGITTTGCCCGHNKLEPFIGVIDEDIPKMKVMGYQVSFNRSRPNDEDQFVAKSVKKNKIINRIKLFLHNVLGHPLMEIVYVFGLRRFGNWIHNVLFKIKH